MPLDRSRIDPKRLTPRQRRVTPKTDGSSLARDLDPYPGAVDRCQWTTGARHGRPTGIVGVCNDCSARSLQSSTIAARDRWSLQRLRRPMIRLTDQASAKLLCSKVRTSISPYARTHARTHVRMYA